MRSGAWAGLVAGAVVVAIGVGVTANAVSDRQRLQAHANGMTGGNAEAGRAALERYPCGSCHQIPGVSGAQGKAAASLDGFAGRAYIDGRLPNVPQNLIPWILNPHAIDPPNAMPNMGVKPSEARDMAAYLYTLN